MKVLGPVAGIAVLACILVAWSVGNSQTPPAGATQPGSGPTTRRKGYANVEVQRPTHFPHRIWAACDFEGERLPDYGWFGNADKQNIAAYPGNTAALKRRTGQDHVGINPVPGPFMGKSNFVYCRYFIKGKTEARFQHFSLSKSDNWNILVKGLSEGKWSEVTLDFNRDARRNDGSLQGFDESDRMDDLKVFFYDTTGAVEMLLDDIIFFALDPSLPPEKEPFPNRVLYVAGFDTGVDTEASLKKFFPGTFQLAERPPAGGLHSAVKGVPDQDGKSVRVVLKMVAKPAGERTAMRFRYWLDGADAMTVLLHNATTGAQHEVELKGLKRQAWTTQYVSFAEAKVEGKPAPIKAGQILDDMTWIVRGAADSLVLYLDEVILYDAGKPTE